MNEIFRLRTSILVQGLGLTLCFLAATFWFASLLFVKNPEQQGSPSKHSMLTLGWFGMSLFAGMAALSAYLVAAYYANRVSITDGVIAIQSVFRSSRLAPSDVDTLRWVPSPHGGKVVFTSRERKTTLDLQGFRPADCLRIIRRLRGFLPEERQEGWPMFCHRVALPLRDGVSPLEQLIFFGAYRAGKRQKLHWPRAAALAAQRWEAVEHDGKAESADDPQHG